MLSDVEFDLAIQDVAEGGPGHPGAVRADARLHADRAELQQQLAAAQARAEQAEMNCARAHSDAMTAHGEYMASEQRAVVAEAACAALREALDSLVFWTGDLLKLARELQSDLKRMYEPIKGWPPHIQALEAPCTDFDAALDQAKNALAAIDAALGLDAKGEVGTT